METGKTRKYLKYAIGEVLLVVIGILIAFSLNNWNSNRLNNNRNQKLLDKLYKELDLNIERAVFLDTTQSGFVDNYKYADSLSKLLRHNKVIDHLDYMVSSPIFAVSTFNLNSSVYQELKNTGSLYSIGSDSLVMEIQKYYQLCERDSYYNLHGSEVVIFLENKCYDGWKEFKDLYKNESPEMALTHHPWISNPRSPQYVHLKQFVLAAKKHLGESRWRLQRIVQESEKLKSLIASEMDYDSRSKNY